MLMIRQLKPYLLILFLTCLILLSSFIPVEIKKLLFAVSLTIKSFILMLLPLIIFGLLFNTMLQMARQATYIILLILACVCLSNFTATFLSHYVGSWIYHFDFSLIVPAGAHELQPAWDWQFPKIIANDKAMGLGIILGIVCGITKIKSAVTLGEILERLVNYILKLFALLIPLFITGFIVKLQYDGVIHTILGDYAKIFIIIALAQFSYILFLYYCLSYGKLPVFLSSVKNMLPAAIAGFSTMSSAAVMPLTIAGVESNTRHKKIARSVVPATVNIHLLGDCVAIPIFAYAVLKSFGMPEPTLLSYLIFVAYFVLAKFSVAAIPGGGMIVMLPVLENYLGFNVEMLSLIMALYILFDPVVTSANVLGNGAFARLIDVIVNRFSRTPAEPEHNSAQVTNPSIAS